MPTVAQYTPNQISPTVVSQPRARGGFTGVDYTPLTTGVARLGAAITDTANRIDTTSAEEALVKFERDKNNIFFNPDNGYFNTQGRNAYDTAQTTNEAVAELKRTYGNDLNDNARKMFDRAADQQISRAQVDINRHSAKGLKAWEVATIESQVENTIENATLYWNQPDKLKVQKALGEQAVIDSAEMMGIGAEATNEKLQTYRSQFAKSSIEAAVDQGAAQGEAAFKEYGDDLEPPQRRKVENLIEKKKKSEETQYTAANAVLTATRIVNDSESRSEIIEQVNQIEDPKLRKATMSQAMYNYNQKVQAEKEAQGESFEEAERFLYNGGSVEVWKTQNSEAWDNLTVDQKKSLDKGESIVTDQVKLSDLLLLPKEQLAKVNPTDHFIDIAPGKDRDKLISAVKSARGSASSSEKDDAQVGRTRTTQTNLAVQELFGKKSDWKKDDIQRVNTFYSVLDSEVDFREKEKGAKLTSEEYTNLLAGLTREYVVNRSKIIPGTTSYDITDIPTEDIEPLTDFLRQNNIPVTADNLYKAYQQARN